MQPERHCHLEAALESGAHHGAQAGHHHPMTHADHGHRAPAASTAQLATHSTLHCLMGCAIGELAGLSIGVTLGFPPWATIALATVLGFASGYLLGLWPLVRTGKSWVEAFRIIWLGETISIAVMELVMNVVDYKLGGVHATSILVPQFWIGYLVALPAGFIAAWPVNYWLLRREIKRGCH